MEILAYISGTMRAFRNFIRPFTGEPWVCLSCGGIHGKLIGSYRASEADHKRLFASRYLVQCQRCGLVQVDPVPTAEELEHFYTEEYRKLVAFSSDLLDPTAFPYDNRGMLSRGRALRNLLGRYVSSIAKLA
jgi:hypothetical protein